MKKDHLFSIHTKGDLLKKHVSSDKRTPIVERVKLPEKAQSTRVASSDAVIEQVLDIVEKNYMIRRSPLAIEENKELEPPVVEEAEDDNSHWYEDEVVLMKTNNYIDKRSMVPKGDTRKYELLLDNAWTLRTRQYSPYFPRCNGEGDDDSEDDFDDESIVSDDVDDCSCDNTV